jgi:hypothetical protein
MAGGLSLLALLGYCKAHGEGAEVVDQVLEIERARLRLNPPKEG